MKRLIAGMGLSGLETALYLKQHQLPFDTYDDHKTAEEIGHMLGGFEGAHHTELDHIQLNRYSEIVISPGMPISHPLVRAAAYHHRPILSEIELAWRAAKGRVIAVTGSNGKSTTVSLIHHILSENGIKSVLCGNIGIPFIGVVDDDPDKVYVVEVSSFQLEHVHEFRPHIGMLLNLVSDHLDRHGSLEAYGAAKKRLFANQTPDDLALTGADIQGPIPGDGFRLPVPGAFARISGTTIHIGDHFTLDTTGAPLMGAHNLNNLLFACAAVQRLGVSAQGVAMALPSFRGLEHRMEPVGEFQGRLWVNDSKATNVHAAQAAIDAMTDRAYVQILGGCDKGERFNGLDFSNHPPKALIAYGQTAPMIMEDLAQYQPIHIHAFNDAVQEAHRLAGPDGLVLLAPACASFDQFKNFARRGEVFKELFHQMREDL